jgi:hypothetical protein
MEASIGMPTKYFEQKQGMPNKYGSEHRDAKQSTVMPNRFCEHRDAKQVLRA